MTNLDTTKKSTKPLYFAYLVMLVTPLFYSSNLIFGKATIPDVAPFTLAFLRWGLCALILFPFVWRHRVQISPVIKNHWRFIFLLAFLSMWVAGAIVYWSLGYTTATNATLIYTTSSIITLALEGLFWARVTKLREILGIIAAFLGITYIIFKGSPEALFSLELNMGDLGILLCASCWALYTILFRSPKVQQIDILPLFGLICCAGALLLLPVAAYEFFTNQKMPTGTTVWTNIAGMVIIASLIAFTGTQYGIRRLGASTTGIFLYLLPPYGVGLAYIFLGETLKNYHFIGIALVLTGVVLATLPQSLLNNIYVKFMRLGNKNNI